MVRKFWSSRAVTGAMTFGCIQSGLQRFLEPILISIVKWSETECVLLKQGLSEDLRLWWLISKLVATAQICRFTLKRGPFHIHSILNEIKQLIEPRDGQQIQRLSGEVNISTSPESQMHGVEAIRQHESGERVALQAVEAFLRSPSQSITVDRLTSWVEESVKTRFLNLGLRSRDYPYSASFLQLLLRHDSFPPGGQP
jgi:hypothetical protein